MRDPSTAKTNSAATRYQNGEGKGLPLKCAWIASKICFETPSIAIGIIAPNARPMIAAVTTPRPECQTRERRGGMLRSARLRSFHRAQNAWALLFIKLVRIIRSTPLYLTLALWMPNRYRDVGA